MQINKFIDIDSKNLPDREKTKLKTKRLAEIENINDKSIVLDFGANFGEVIESLLPTKCKIYSFEPHPVFYNILLEKYSKQENVFLFNKAIWTSNVQKKLYYKKSRFDLNGGATLISEKTNIKDLTLYKEVNCIDIVDFLKDFEFIDVLKMDIEGAEYHILDKIFENKLHNKINSIYYEDHSKKILTKRYSDMKKNVFENFNKINKKLYSW